ncbi:MAG: prolipoprotein diacylglyceryl transferase [Bacteroidetes bacterium]|nr:prolipoprotein diacylglyceryl transferase [Bacteroidota bacterium]
MFPIIFKFKTPEFFKFLLPDYISIYSYGLFIGLGIIASYYIVLKKTKNIGINRDNLSGLYLWSFLAAFVGGKLLYFLEKPSKYINNPSEILENLGNGFVFYGSMLLVIPTIIFWLRKNKIPVLKFFDGMAWGAPILHSFGRLGCFMAGCCHGKVCKNFMGVVFSNPLSAANPKNVPLYPTQLYDIAVNLITLIVIYFVSKKQKFSGQLFIVYIILYAFGRIVVENFRGDENRGFIFDNAISYSQFIAILLIIISSFLWYFLYKKSKSKV